MSLGTLKKSGWKLTKPIEMLKVGEYAGWQVFFNLIDAQVFFASDGVHRNVKGKSLKEIQHKINKKENGAEILRRHCKTITTDTRKCDYCNQRFICFTDKAEKEKA